MGAGPVGLTAAAEAAERGVDVKVFEEHLQIGYPRHCAGLISVSGLRDLELLGSKELIQAEVRGVRVFSPSGFEAKIDLGVVKAYVVDRAMMDMELARRAVRLGAEIVLGRRVRRVELREGKVAVLRVGDRRVEAGVVLDCEGAARRVLRASELLGKLEGVMPAVNVEVRGVEVEEGFVEVHLGRNVAPNFFAWVIPLGESMARCGLACPEADPLDRCTELLRRRFGRFKVTSIQRGLLVHGGPIGKTAWPGLLAVGDAAGQVKPTTGGGVVFGCSCARTAGRLAAEALSAEDPWSVLSRYEEAWRSEWGDQTEKMAWMLRLFRSLTDRDLDRVVRFIDSISGDLSEILREADMDRHGEILAELSSRPGILSKAVRHLGVRLAAKLVGML